MDDKEDFAQKMEVSHIVWIALFARGEHYDIPKKELQVMANNRHVGYNKKTRMYEPTPRGYRDALIMASRHKMDPHGVVQLLLDIPDEHLDVLMPYHKIIPNPIPIGKLHLG